ncbi:MAG: hypothetical protein K8823_1551 [Cenarchaeum symbiont of Oopsacas minuta]|nr:hypothetical protein [Cenarchaeum symbiont of Oopsacas minuta]
MSFNNPDYGVILERLLEIYQHDDKLKAIIKSWRFGALAVNEYQVSITPAIFVKMGAELQGLRTNAGVGTNEIMPPQKIPSVFHTVIVCSTNHRPEDVQKQQYTIVSIVNNILANNMQLRKPTDRSDPKVSNSIVLEPIRYNTERNDNLTAAVNIPLRAIIYSR